MNCAARIAAIPIQLALTQRWKWFVFTWLMVFVLIVAIWLAGDFIYARIVLSQLDRYERTLDWDERGVRRGEEAFEQGSGDTAILFVHGINFSPIAFRNLGPELAQQGIKIRAMRLPGFAQRVREYSNFQYFDWVAAVDREISALAVQHDRVLIAAHSLGAAIVIKYLLERNPEVDGTILIAPAIEVSNARSPVLPTRFWHEFAKRTLVFTRIVLSPYPYDVRDSAVIGTIPAKQFTPRAIVDQTFALIDANRGQASRIRVPLLMIVSPSDQVISSPAAETYFREWGTDRKTLLVQDRAGHMIPLDFGWQDAAEAIARFVENLESNRFNTEIANGDTE